MGNSDIEQVQVLEARSEPEKTPSTAFRGDYATGVVDMSPVEKRLLIKARLLLATLMALMYFAAYLDRHSIGNASVMGMAKDLHIGAHDYSNVLSMFYVGYVICMLPANIIQRKFSPHYIVGTSCTIFGLSVACMAAARNYGAMLGLRILVGFAQSFIQGMTVYLSLWFRRDEIAGIAAIIYSAATISGAFGGFIAYGIEKNAKLSLAVSGLEPWRWLFIIEGCIGVFVGILFYTMLPRFPDRLQERGGKHWFFTKEEIDVACERTSSFNTMGAKVEVRQILIALTSPLSWGFALVNGGVASGIATIGVFLPTFVRELGYSKGKQAFYLVNAQLFSVIPYAVAFVSILVTNHLSDRFNKKGIPLVCCLSTATIGLIVIMTEAPTAGKMAALCLVASGVYPSVTLLAAWCGSNIAGFTKRATTWAMAEITGQCLSIMATKIYNTPPRYFKGHGVLLGLLAFGVIDCVVLMWWMRKENVRREAEVGAYMARGETHPHESKSLEDVQDLHASFRYII